MKRLLSIVILLAAFSVGIANATISVVGGGHSPANADCIISSVGGTTTNDTIIWEDVYDSSGGTTGLTGPTGFTQFEQWNIDKTNITWYWKNGTNSEPATYKSTISNGSLAHSCGLGVFRGVRVPSDPIDVIGTPQESCSGGTCTASSITTLSDNDALIWGGGSFFIGAIVGPASYSTVWEEDGTFFHVAAAGKFFVPQTPPGSTGNVDGTVGGAGAATVFLFALKGSPGPSPTATPTATATATATPTATDTPTATPTATPTTATPTATPTATATATVTPTATPSCTPPPNQIFSWWSSTCYAGDYPCGHATPIPKRPSR